MGYLDVARSVDLRLDQADRHLVEIDRLVADYRASNPWNVVESIEGRRKHHVYRLRVEEPDDRIAVVVGDFMHNVRSSLNYLMTGIVPSNRRYSTQFPIFSEDPFARAGRVYIQRDPGGRRNWARYVKGVNPQALGIIEQVQPYHETRDGVPTFLGWLSAASNADKHSRLAAVSGGARRFQFVVKDAQTGVVTHIAPMLAADPMHKDGTEVFRAQSKMNVEFDGAAEVVIKTGKQGFLVPVGELRRMLEVVYRDVVGPLTPFLRR